MKFVSRVIYFSVLFASLSACSGYKKSVEVQVPSETWWRSAAINSDAGNAARNLADVRQKMMKVTPFSFVVGLSDSSEINAYAELQNNQRYIIFTNAFIVQFGNDPDVLAGVMGHELAHHQLGHTQTDYGKNRDLLVSATSQALGIIASYFVPFSGFVVGNVAKGAGLSFSRDDERAADLQGMEWAYKAGYSPCGSYRFANKLNYMSEGASLAFLSTHPGNNERMENALAFAQIKNIPSCSNDQDVNRSK